jgi:membrane protein DedA with SNARE-associated domain/membrane-associated phospholipid phosphatase
MPESLALLLARYGYLVVFFGVFLENAGVPVPGETVLLAAAFFAHQGTLSLPWVIGIAVVAAILGDNLGYWIGRRGGRSLATRHGAVVGLTPARLAALEDFFNRHGAKTVFLARFVTGLRVFAALVAGISGLRWPRFAFYNAAGAVTWAVAVGVAGYLFAESWDLLHRWLGRAGLFGIGLAIALVLLTLAHRHWSRLAAAAEAWRPAALTRRELALAAASLGAVSLFAKIAEDVAQHESTGFDRAVSLAVHHIASPALDLLMRSFTLIGSTPAVVVVVLALGGRCWYRGDRRAASALAAVAAMTEALNFVLKEAFHRARPSLWDVVALHSYSFPSGHAMAAVAIYGMAAVVAVRLWPRLTRVAEIGMPLLALLIGISRVYLGAHWPTDVLAGFAAGTFILSGGVYVLYRLSEVR